MMRRTSASLSLIAALAVVLFAAPRAGAQEASFDDLDISAIKSIRIEMKEGLFTSKVVALFSNKGATELKLRNAKLTICFKSADSRIVFGDTYLDDFVIPRNAEKGGPSDKLFDVKIGESSPLTIARLVGIFNLLGDPAAEFTLTLTGEGELGRKIERGWVYQKGISIDLDFKPSIQREVLFK